MQKVDNVIALALSNNVVIPFPTDLLAYTLLFVQPYPFYFTLRCVNKIFNTVVLHKVGPMVSTLSLLPQTQQFYNINNKPFYRVFGCKEHSTSAKNSSIKFHIQNSMIQLFQNVGHCMITVEQYERNSHFITALLQRSTLQEMTIVFTSNCLAYLVSSYASSCKINVRNIKTVSVFRTSNQTIPINLQDCDQLQTLNLYYCTMVFHDKKCGNVTVNKIGSEVWKSEQNVEKMMQHLTNFASMLLWFFYLQNDA